VSCLSALVTFASIIFPGPAAAQEATVERVADDVYFLFDFNGSNSVFLVTEEGVLLIDTRTHPREGSDLLDHIRRVTDKPIKWVINSHFHGDHLEFGIQGAGSDIRHARGDRADHAVGPEVRLLYLGPGQNAGDTFVHFPHARLLFTPGAFAKHSMPNMAFTPSVDNWLALLDRIAAMDVDAILPAHGDVARRADVNELSAMLADEYATVKESVSRGVSLDQAVRTLTFPQYKDWRNYGRLQGEIKALYELIQTGKRSYFE
jgi:glyoxylase-like metal-dependent hydrolase (beta-lactamase superfamily II)